MQVDSDQVQTHPMAFLRPQHSPAASSDRGQTHGVQPGRGGTGTGQVQSKIRQQRSREGQGVQGDAGGLHGRDGVGRKFSLCLGLSFIFIRWLMAQRRVGGKPRHGEVMQYIRSDLSS